MVQHALSWLLQFSCCNCLRKLFCFFKKAYMSSANAFISLRPIQGTLHLNMNTSFKRGAVRWTRMKGNAVRRAKNKEMDKNKTKEGRSHCVASARAWAATRKAMSSSTLSTRCSLGHILHSSSLQSSHYVPARCREARATLQHTRWWWVACASEIQQYKLLVH